MSIFTRISIAPIFVYGSAEGLSRCLNLIALPLITQFFSVGEFGQIALLTSSIGIVGLFANCGLSNAVHRFYFEPPGTKLFRNVIVCSGFVGVVLLSIICILVAIIGVAILQKISGGTVVELKAVVVVGLLAVLPIQLLQYGQDVMRLYSAHWKYFFIAVFKNIIVVMLALSLVYFFNTGVIGYFIGILAGNFLLIPLVIHGMREAIKVKPSVWEIKNLVGYGSPFIIAGLSQLVIASIDLWILGFLRSDADVGMFSISLKLASMVAFVNAAFSLAWSPHLLRIQAEDPNYKRVVGKLIISITSLLVFISCVVTTLAPELFKLLFPAEYGRPILLVGMLSISTAIAGTAQMTVVGMVYERRSDLIAKVTSFVALTSAFTSYAFVTCFGLLGAAISNLLISILLTSLYFYMTQKIHNIIFSSKDVFYLIGNCSVMLTICIFFALVEHTTMILSFELFVFFVLSIFFWRCGGWASLVNIPRLSSDAV